MGHILGLASASAALTTALGLLTGIILEPTLPPRALTAASTEAAPARAVRTIPIDGRYGGAAAMISR
ncbi:hypothetical protein [Methylobacterium gregans]|uniref:Uncharacterized protein n=1 Tax=Methylobacterium gregans TaxID=374424 RepID=A0AA37HKD2_9HYPH|nr:hypothetical protein [Methylobacterium gregans]MDQ0523344.1 anti-sigma factor RsiW [Methylobacterium gregans]GJD77185.1 hypothetical protein NBEOAGPD_0388 [Methylobacterium gregans]GLS53435.1 hypothetical protein GCM10007886_16180 [Methylobacterium gregans]